MLPGRLAASGAARVALFALVAVVIGAGLWLVGDDGASPATTRLEATQTSVDPLLGYAPTTPWDTAASAPLTPAPTPGPAVAPGTESVPAEAGGAPASTWGSPAPSTASGNAAPVGWPAAVGGRANSVDGGVEGGTGSASEETPSARGTGAATSSADTSGAASSPASAPSAGAGAGAGAGSPSTTEPTTTSTPTTQAPTTTAAPAPAPAPRSSGGLSRHPAAEAEVVPLTNDDRAAAGLGSLSRNSCLDSVASGYAEQMARSGVLAHNPGAGAAVAGCRTNPTWGDNVGTSKPCDTARLEREWMDSPSHRRNILTGAFTLIGVGAWTDEKGACWVQVLFSS